MHCGHCGAEIDDGLDVCPACQGDVCFECGAAVGPDDTVCPSCGATWTLVCPACEGEGCLYEHDRGETRRHCTACEGRGWLPNAEAERVRDALEVARAALRQVYPMDRDRSDCMMRGACYAANEMAGYQRSEDGRKGAA